MNNANEAQNQLDQLTSFLVNAISAQQQHQYAAQLQTAIQQKSVAKKYQVQTSSACTVQRIDPVTRRSVLYRPGSSNQYLKLSSKNDDSQNNEKTKSYAGILKNDNKDRHLSGGSNESGQQASIGLQQNTILQQACQQRWMENVKQQQYAWFVKNQQQYQKARSFKLSQKNITPLEYNSDYQSCDTMSSSDTGSYQLNQMSFSNPPSPTPTQQKKISTDEEDDDILSDLNKQINLICFS